MLHSRLCFPILALIASALATALPWKAGAQNLIAVTLQCGPGLNPVPGDDSCTGEMVQADSMQRFEVHLQLSETGGLRAGVAGAVVRLRASSGTIVGDSTTSGPDGTIRALWFRKRSTDGVGIGVEAYNPEKADRRYSTLSYIQLKPPTPTTTLLRFDETQTFPLAGFENTTLRRPMIVEIRTQTSAADTEGKPIINPVECQAHRVVFRGSAGTMTPDSAVPEVYAARDANDPNAKFELGCRAQAYWSLGAGAGPREARVSLVPGSGHTLAQQAPYRWDVRARSVPRFVLGAVLRRDEPYVGRDDGDEVTLRVERKLPDGTTISFDSTDPGTVTVDSVGSTSWGVMVGVSSSIPTGYTNRLTVIGGVDLTSPLDHQYLGLSMFRVLDLPETLPIDLSVLAHFGKTNVLKRPDDCRQGISTVHGEEPCATDERRGLRGVAFMFSIDAGTLLADAIKKLGT
jgi:hypothetical protein